ncbi:MAG: hypothetical protein GY715_15155 [Planctomycetes bacterium]|nr:hypothetical protein [Planctomycetota bacterium]
MTTRTTRRNGTRSTTKPTRSSAPSRRAPRRGSLTGVSAAALKAELDRRLTELGRRRDKLERELATVEAEIARHAYNGHAITAGRAKPGARRPRNATNLVEALRKLLKRRTLSVTEMAIAVQEAGYRTSSPNFRTIVNQTLINNPKTFKRVARGRYTTR